MQTIIAAAALIALVMLAMAVGVIFSNRALQGSCGGTGAGCACTPEKRRRCAAEHAGDE